MRKWTLALSRSVGEVLCKPDKRFLVGVLILAAALCAGWVSWLWGDYYPSVPDTYNYFLEGASLAAGEGFLVDGQLVTHWPVGYPAVLALAFKALGPTIGVVFVVNAIAFVVGLYLLWRLSLETTRSWFAANVTVTMALFLLPNRLMYVGMVRSENVMIAVLLAGLLFLNRAVGRSWKHGILPGVCFGLLAHIRPEQVTVPAVFLGAMWLLKRSFRFNQAVRLLVIVYVVVLCMVAPWTIRLSQKLHNPTYMSTSGGVAFFHANNPYANGYPSAMDRVNEIDPPGMTPVQYTLKYVREHPSHMVRLLPLKLKALFFPSPGSSTPTDSMTSEKLPDYLTLDEFDRAMNSRYAADRHREILSRSLNVSADGSRYVVNQDMSDLDKARFQHHLLMTFAYQFPTPRGFIYLRYLQQWIRWVFVGLLSCSILVGALWPQARRVYLSLPGVVALSVVGLSIVGFFMIFSGCNRYAMPIDHLLLVAMAVIMSVCVKFVRGESCQAEVEKGCSDTSTITPVS